MYTICPNCKAQFSVTQESLDIADGMVRCGQCDHIFNATLYLTEKQATLNTDASSSLEKSVQKEYSPQPDESLPIDDSLPVDEPASSEDELEIIDYHENEVVKEADTPELIDDNDTHEIDPLDVEIYKSLSDDDSQSLETELSINEGSLDDELLDSGVNHECSDTSDDTDLSLDDQFFGNNEPGNNESAIENSLNNQSLDTSLDQELPETTKDSEPSLNEMTSGVKKNIDRILGTQSSDNTDNLDDLDSGEDLLAQLDQLEKSYNNATTDDDSSAEDFMDTSSSTSDDDTFSEDDFSTIEESIVMEDTSLPERKRTDAPSSAEASLSATQKKDEPAYFGQSSFIKQSPVALFSWLAGCILLLLILGAQYLHVNSHLLAQNNTFRPFLETLCPISQCELPLLKATDKIITVEHDIFSHKIFKNALEVQLTFKNKASVKQAYPILEIVFSNPLGAVIAQRKFLPSEYLENKTQISLGMNSNQSQKVKLEIIDPDPTALLSFQFNYL